MGEEYGIKYGLHSGFYVNNAEIMPKVGKASEEQLLEYIQLTEEIGAEYCVLHCGYHFSQFHEFVIENLFETSGRARLGREPYEPRSAEAGYHSIPPARDSKGIRSDPGWSVVATTG